MSRIDALTQTWSPRLLSVLRIVTALPYIEPPQAFQNRGELAVLCCFVFLSLWVAGPGPWSVDTLLLQRGR